MALLQEIKVPLLAVNDTTLTVVELGFSTGSKVNKGDVLMVFETSKTTYDVEAETGGYIQYLCEADRDYEVNALVARIYSEAAEAVAVVAPGLAVAPGAAVAPVVSVLPEPIHVPVASRPSAVAPEPAGMQATPPRHWEGETRFSREAARLMETHGIGRAAFAGRDLVTGADILEYLQALTPGAALAPGAASNPAASTSAARRSGLAAPNSGLAAPNSGLAAPKPTPAAKQATLAPDPAKAILQRLTSAKRREIEYLSDVQSPGITSTIDIYVDTENIFTHINKSLKYFKDSLLPVILYESSRLLVSYPLLNAWFTGDGVAVYHEVNPGFAIDIDKGLKVLKIARAGSKTIAEIEADILQLSGSYLDETLELEALTDITFTITDLSSEGVAFFRPLVNKMNSAILGVSAIDNKLKRCVLSLTFDHRVTEGRHAARFLHELKERLESYRPVDLAEYKDITCFKCYKTLKEDLGTAGFARCITPAGKDGYICQSCLKGF